VLIFLNYFNKKEPFHLFYYFFVKFEASSKTF
jgi:hypothetical protein